MSFLRPSRKNARNLAPTSNAVERLRTHNIVETSPALGVQSIKCPALVTLPLVSNPVFQSLYISAPLLFHATFLPWTIHTLNTAPLTTLSLDSLDLAHYDWALILPLLTIPALRTLVIGQYCAIPVPYLTAFLARHPRIHTLDLSWHVAIGALRPPVAEPILPRLGHLLGSPDYLVYFLGGTHAEGEKTHPDLRRISVMSHDHSAYQQAQFGQLVEIVERMPVGPQVEVVGRFANFCRVPVHLQTAP